MPARSSGFLILLSSALLSLLLLSTPSYAGTKEDAVVLFTNILKGTHTLGGRKPGIDNIHIRGKENFSYASGKYFFRLKAFVRRSGGDRDGRMVVFSAPTWGGAVKKLTGFRPNLREDWALRLLMFGYAKKFPPIVAEYTYLIGARSPAGRHLGFNVLNRVRRRQGAQRFVEDLPWEFAPGVYEISLSNEVTLASHPILSLMDVWEWFDFANKVRKVELPSLLDLGKDAVKWVIKQKLTRSSQTYRVVVKAKVPKVVGKTPWEANFDLTRWNLRGSVKYSNKCHSHQYGRIIKQWPSPRKLLDPRKPMSLSVCSRRAPTPLATATARPSASPYYLFHLTNAANNLYIGTEDSLKGRTQGSFQGAGNNYSILVTYRKLSGPHATRQLAEQALCKGLAARWNNAVVPWGPYVNFLGTTYAAFDPSVESIVWSCKIMIIK